MFKWFSVLWLIENYFTLYGGLFGGGEAEAPDYKPVAEASKEAAEISAQLGREQLAQAQAQYDKNMAVTKPVVDAQLALMEQQQQQGADFYKQQQALGKPIETSLSYAALGLTDNEALASQFDTLNAKRAALLKEQSTYQKDSAAATAQKPSYTYGQAPTTITYNNKQYSPQDLLAAANAGDEKAAKALTGAGFNVQQAQIGTTTPAPVSAQRTAFGMGDYAAGATAAPTATAIKAYQFTQDAQSKLAGAGTSFSSGNDQLDAFLKSSGVAYQEPKYAVDYQYTTGTGKSAKTVSNSLAPEAALSKLNTLQGQLATEQAKSKPNANTLASLQSELSTLSTSMKNSGYAVAAGTDGKMQFTADPRTTYALKVADYKTNFGNNVERYRKQLGVAPKADPNAGRDFDAELSAYDQQLAELTRTADRAVSEKDAAARAELKGLNTNYAARIGESNNDVYLRNKADIDAETDMAVADSRNGFTNSINMAAREGLRYGFSPDRLAAQVGTQSTAQAAKTASAANTTRKAATDVMYGRGVGESGQLLTGGTADRNYKIQDDSINTAKKLDIAGLYRGVTGASQGAYGLSLNAGNSAVQNNAQAGNTQAAQTAAGINTIQQGINSKINGLSSIMGSQTSIYNANAGNGDALLGTLGQLGGAALSNPAVFSSDKNIKKDVKPIDDDEALNAIAKTGISEWRYDRAKVVDGERIDDKPHIGAMAQDLKKNMGSTVSSGKEVDVISAIGITMSGIKALNKKVDQLARAR